MRRSQPQGPLHSASPRKRLAWGLMLAGLLQALPVASQHILPQSWRIPDGSPYALLLDAQNQLYASVQGTNTVVRISPQGEVQPLAPTGQQPMGLAMDDKGLLYVINHGDNTVSRIGPDGRSTVLAPTGRQPAGIAYDALQGVLYVSNSGDDTVSRITLDGQVRVHGRTGQMPTGIATDAVGNVYTANFQAGTVTRIRPDGQSQELGRTGLYPLGIAVSESGHIYVANHGSNTVTHIAPDGRTRTLGPTGLHPFGIALAPDGTVYTTDHHGNTVTRITTDGKAQIWAAAGEGPMGIAIDKAGRVYTAAHQSQSVTQLSNMAAPPAPKYLRLSTTEDQQMSLQWQAPASDVLPPIQAYVLEHRILPNGAWTTRSETADSSQPPQIQLSGLDWRLPHEFRVSAVNWVGLGPPSEPVRWQPSPQTGNAPVPAPAPAQPVSPQPVQPQAVQTAAACPRLITRPIRLGRDNTPEEVNRLIGFLSVHEGEALLMDGSFDQDDMEAVKRFQLKYRQDILTPWGLGLPNGVVSTMTMEKINTIWCKQR